MKKIFSILFLLVLLTGCVQQTPVNEKAKIDETSSVSNPYPYPNPYPSRNSYVKQSCLDKKIDNIWYPFIEDNKESETYGDYGYKNTSNDEIMVPAEYDMIFDGCYDSTKRKGFAATSKEGGVWYTRPSGEKIIRAYTWNGPDDFDLGLARFVENEKIGFMDEELNKVIPAQFDWASLFKDGEAIICNGCELLSNDEHATRSGGVWGKVNLKGEVQWNKE